MCVSGCEEVLCVGWIGFVFMEINVGWGLIFDLFVVIILLIIGVFWVEKESKEMVVKVVFVFFLV